MQISKWPLGLCLLDSIYKMAPRPTIAYVALMQIAKWPPQPMIAFVSMI